jgi:hypothetical protein
MAEASSERTEAPVTRPGDLSIDSLRGHNIPSEQAGRPLEQFEAAYALDDHNAHS